MPAERGPSGTGHDTAGWVGLQRPTRVAHAPEPDPAADPVVSPADTIRLKAAAEAALPGQIDGGWYETDSLAIDSVDRPDAVFIAAATPQLILALLAVGERDRAEREQFLAAALDYKGQLRDALSAGERDRQQIARLTEAANEVLADAALMAEGTLYHCATEPMERLMQAVLAGEEDAANG